MKRPLHSSHLEAKHEVEILRTMDGTDPKGGYPMNFSIIEGVNNRIKVSKRMAYGFRYSANFVLTIKAAFPSKAR